ncbi:MAG: type II toxin-antitoxin system VapC family toxin [Candidatus Aenigmarchaeota archaeon]|nr:type II toxin-antitoxin system VapC family toxin [Candidatus Aenigmarchaeota archaeon]
MIILDTSFLVSYKIENDENHEKAAKIKGDIVDGKYGNPVISDYIFDETLTVVFVRSKNLSVAVEMGDELRNFVKIIKIGDDVLEGSWDLFKNQKDTTFSFTDCTSVALMKNENIINIATFDGDFKKIKEISVVS